MVYHAAGSARKDVDRPACGTRRGVCLRPWEIHPSRLLGSSGSVTNLSGCSRGVPSSNLPTLVARPSPGTCYVVPATPESARGGPAGHVGRQTFRPTPCQTHWSEAIKMPRSLRVWAVSAICRKPVAACTSPRWEDPGHCRAEVARGHKQNLATTPPTQRIRTGLRAPGYKQRDDEIGLNAPEGAVRRPGVGPGAVQERSACLKLRRITFGAGVVEFRRWATRRRLVDRSPSVPGPRYDWLSGCGADVSPCCSQLSLGPGGPRRACRPAAALGGPQPLDEHVRAVLRWPQEV